MLKLKDITNDLIGWIKANVPQLGMSVRRYKGELDGAQWNPDFPICFVKFSGSEDEVAMNDGASVIMSYGFDLIVGVEFEKTDGTNMIYDSGEMAEKIFDGINGQTGTTDGGADYTVIAKRCAWVKSLGRNEVYKVSVKII